MQAREQDSSVLAKLELLRRLRMKKFQSQGIFSGLPLQAILAAHGLLIESY